MNPLPRKRIKYREREAKEKKFPPEVHGLLVKVGKLDAKVVDLQMERAGLLRDLETTGLFGEDENIDEFVRTAAYNEITQQEQRAGKRLEKERLRYEKRAKKMGWKAAIF